MVQVIIDLHDNTGMFFNESGYVPFPNSQAALELQTYKRPESLNTAYSQGTVLIEVVADQLMAITKTLKQPVQTIAPWTCTRAALEASALATWLLETNINAHTRVQRSFAFRFEGLSQQEKFAHLVGTNEEIIRIKKRIEQVEADALNLGFSKIHNQKGKIIGIAQHIPSITDIVKQTLHEEEAYRLLSAITHAHNWALQHSSFRSVSGKSVSLSGDISIDEDIPFIEKSLSTLSVSFLCMKAAYIFAKPIWFKCKLFGWDADKLQAMFNYAFDELGVSRSYLRFWN